jgi:signal transduction histidine kinase/ligand-binding sensor domain-containing protein/DNA-binding response OmpR family regulator
MKRFLLIVFLFGWVQSRGQPTSFYFEPLFFGHPMSESTVLAIQEGKKGFMWLGTTQGLVRFDGYEYRYFQHQPDQTNGLSNNRISEILMDDDGRFWLGTDGGGVCLFDPEQERFSLIVPGRITSAAYGSKGKFWFGTRGEGLLQLDPESGEQMHWKHEPDKAYSLSSNHVWEVLEASNGFIWAGTDRGADQWNPVTGTFANYSFQSKPVKHIYEDRNGTIWTSTETGLHRFDSYSNTFETVSFPADFSKRQTSSISDIFEDSQGRFWLSFHHGPLALLNRETNRFQSVRDQHGLIITDVEVIKEFGGELWFGTIGKGYLRFDPKPRVFRYLKIPSNPAETGSGYQVRRLLLDQRHCVWGVGDRGLFRVDIEEMNIQRFLPPHRPGRMTDLIELSDNTLLLATSDGLMRFHPDTERFVRLSFPSLLASPPNVLAQSEDGSIWLGSDEGLFEWNPQTDRLLRFTPPTEWAEAFSKTELFALLVDSKNQLWIGTNGGGLFRIDLADRDFQVFQYQTGIKSSLSDNFIQSIAEDHTGSIWISTREGGVNRFLPEEEELGFQRWTVQDAGIASNHIYGTVEDLQGNIWMGTAAGLSCYHPSDRQIFHFDYQDGLTTHDLNGWGFVQHPSGILLMGGRNGIVLINPGAFHRDLRSAAVVITDIFLSDQQMNVSEKGGLPLAAPYVQTLELHGKQDHLAFSFSDLQFSYPRDILFQYRLKGWEQDWLTTDGSSRKAVYTDLRPGSYVFQVAAVHQDHEWPVNVAQIALRIRPPWWASWWAILIWSAIAVFLASLLLLFHRSRLKVQAQAEQIRELDAVKSRFFFNVSHEFRTPLTIVLGMAEQIAKTPGRWAQEGSEMILRNGRYLLNLVNHLLDLSKIDSGAMAIRYQQGNIVEYLRYILQSFESYAEQQDVRLHFLPVHDATIMDYDAEKMLNIVSNLISNAIKFTPAGGAVYFEVGERIQGGKPFLQIQVRDTGIGIPEEQLPNIFDRFFQADNHHSSMLHTPGGTGVGLTLSKELVEMMNGRIEVASTVGKGSLFSVFLPIVRSSEPADTPDASVVARRVGAFAALPKTQSEQAEGAEDSLPLALVLEDNMDVRRYLMANLSDDFRLLFASNGNRGLELAFEQIPDIVISDVILFGKNGYQVCAALKNDERTSHVPVILLTSRADLESRLAGLERGADAYLSKPFHPEELLLRMKKLLELRHELHKCYGAESEGALPLAPTQDQESQFLKKVRQVVERHLDDFDFGVKEMAEELHLSPSQLNRKLSAVTGISPNRYIRTIRLAKACELLKTPDLTITAIAMDTGFQDPDYFSKVFHKELGCTPTQYREKQAG